MSITLNYKVFGEGFPVIILHGLLGSLDNWQTPAKQIAEKFKVYIVDERNHGKSPHSDVFTYQTLSDDLLDFMNQHQIQQAHLIGHSMGGKAVMLFALQHPERVGKLVVVDVAPTGYEDRHSQIFKALFAADVEHKTSREEMQNVLMEKLQGDNTVVQFLMKGLQRSATGSASFEWKFNLPVLWNNYHQVSIGLESETPYKGEVLFIKGQKSDYISAQNYPRIDELFPNNHLAEIPNAGHWVHAENPVEFLKEVMNFLG